jgi:hypothetical protein
MRGDEGWVVEVEILIRSASTFLPFREDRFNFRNPAGWASGQTGIGKMRGGGRLQVILDPNDDESDIKFEK